MKKKIIDLFKYRKLPELLSYGPYGFDSPLVGRLVDLQIAIYQLDQYLESNWKTSKRELNKYWKQIHEALSFLSVPENEHDDYLKHLKKYQQHELAMRSGKYPTSLSLKYYYFYKSCDVKLIRRIIYDFIPSLKKMIKLSEWRAFDLITEINDDVEDVYEDVGVINGNYFQFELAQKGKEFTSQKFDKTLLEAVHNSNSDTNRKETKLRKNLYRWTKTYGQETRKLLKSRIKEIDLDKIKPKTLTSI